MRSSVLARIHRFTPFAFVIFTLVLFFSLHLSPSNPPYTCKWIIQWQRHSRPEFASCHRCRPHTDPQRQVTQCRRDAPLDFSLFMRGGGAELHCGRRGSGPRGSVATRGGARSVHRKNWNGALAWKRHVERTNDRISFSCGSLRWISHIVTTALPDWRDFDTKMFR